jgi:uncharacterized membrane protein YphA (DoxX/SURF4 family)
MNQYEQREQFSFSVLRLLLALLIGLHGWYRILNGGVESYAVSLSSNAVFGMILAVSITALQAFGSILFAFKRFVFALSLAFATLYGGAIIFHHAQHGWFTSGAKEDGMEYAVMLMILSMCVGWQYLPAKMPQRQRQ